MSKKALADLLRKRLLSMGLATKENLDRMSDQAMIESYVVCADCGHWEVPKSELDDVVDKSESVEDFFSILDNHPSKQKCNRDLN